MMDFNATERVPSEAHRKQNEKSSLDFIAQIKVRMKQVCHDFSSLLPKPVAQKCSYKQEILYCSGTGKIQGLEQSLLTT